MLPAQIWWQDPMKFSSAFLFPTQYRKNKEKNKQTKLYLYLIVIVYNNLQGCTKNICTIWQMKLQSPLFVGNKGNVCGKMPLQADNAPTINLFFLQRGQWKTYQHKKSCPGQSWSWSALVSNVRSRTSQYYISLWSGFRNIDDPKTERLSGWATHQVISNQ